MAAKSKFQELQERIDKPLAHYLLERLNTLHSINMLAGEIDISPRYITGKIDELGIVEEPRRWRLSEPEHADS